MKKIKINKLYERFNRTLANNGTYGYPAQTSLVRIEISLRDSFSNWKRESIRILGNEKY